MNTKSKRGNGVKITPDEKKQMTESIVTMKLEGMSFNAISVEIQCTFETVKKYWDEFVTAQGDVDPTQLLKERRLITERVLEKSLRQYYSGMIPIKDVSIAMEQADKYNGLNQYLDKLVVAAQLPPLLEIRVQTSTIRTTANQRLKHHEKDILSNDHDRGYPSHQRA